MGTATAKFEIVDAGVRKYLQADLTTFSATEATHALAFVAGIGWSMGVTIPLSAKGFTLAWTLLHSNVDLPPMTDSAYVTKHDSDVLKTAIEAMQGGLN